MALAPSASALRSSAGSFRKPLPVASPLAWEATWESSWPSSSQTGGGSEVHSARGKGYLVPRSRGLRAALGDQRALI